MRDPRYAPAGDVEVAKMLAVGDRVWMDHHRRAWRVRARDERYVVLTQPASARRTVLYTIIDLELGIRGPSDNWGSSFESDDDVAESLRTLIAGDAAISVRNNVSVEISPFPSEGSGER